MEVEKKRRMDIETTIDESALNQIRALQQPGGEDLVRKIIQLFLDDAARLHDIICEGVRSGDAEAVGASSHSLKSSSANVGAVRVAAISHELEMAARAGEVESAQALADTLGEALAQARVRLSDQLSA